MNSKYCIKRPFSVRDTTSVIIVCILRSINIHSMENKRIVKIIILNNLLISRYQSFFNQGFLSFFPLLSMNINRFLNKKKKKYNYWCKKKSITHLIAMHVRFEVSLQRSAKQNNLCIDVNKHVTQNDRGCLLGTRLTGNANHRINAISFFLVSLF